MYLTQCAHGHYYDMDKYGSCPFCSTLNNPGSLITDTEEVEGDVFLSASDNQKSSQHEADEPYAFISYSHMDLDIINHYLEVISPTYRLWYDKGIKSGDESFEIIANKIYYCEVFIVFLSASAVNSRYILDEITFAYKYAKKMLAVFLEPVVLKKSLDLMFNRFQYIEYSDQLSEQDVVRQLMAGIPETVKISSSGNRVVDLKRQAPLSQERESKLSNNEVDFEELGCLSDHQERTESR